MSSAGQESTPAPASTGDEAVARLRELGLDVASLHTALDAGDVAARQATRDHPVTAAGTLRWLETVAALRRVLREEFHWKGDDVRSSPRTVRPDRGVALLAASGDRWTGVNGRDPQTARSRGATTVRAVDVNEQLTLPMDLAALADAAAERLMGTATWILLYRRSDRPNELRAELSLPVQVNEKGRVIGWKERILLPARTFGPDLESALDARADSDDDEQGGDEVVVRVDPR